MASKQVAQPRAEFSAAHRQQMVEGLRILARLDLDFAQIRNEQGFGKRTTAVGHELARYCDLYTEREQADAWEILYTHRSQVPPALLEGLGIPVPAPRGIGKPRARRVPGKYVRIVEALMWDVPFAERHFVRAYVDDNGRRPRDRVQWRHWCEDRLWERDVGVWVSEEDWRAAQVRAEAYRLRSETEMAARKADEAARKVQRAAWDAEAQAKRETRLAA